MITAYNRLKKARKHLNEKKEEMKGCDDNLDKIIRKVNGKISDDTFFSESMKIDKPSGGNGQG